MTLRIQVEPGAGMNDEEYMAWNIEGATRRLRDAPEEAEITLVVYEIHRAMMAKRGVSEYRLSQMDGKIREASEKYLH